MIYSMTGYGRAEATDELGRVSVDIKSVNHRYLDLSVRLPRRMLAFETDIRNLIKEKTSRGKLEIHVTYEDLSEGTRSLKCDMELAGSYLSAADRMSAELGLADDVTLSQVMGMEGVLSIISSDEVSDELKSLLMEAVKDAYEDFNAARAREGEALKDDLLKKLSDMSEYVKRIDKLYPKVVEAYRLRLYDKLKEILADTTVDESRMAQETVIYADKICVDEETVRLKSHIDAMKKTLKKTGAVGKKLDFLAQEMARESNTILSKSTNAKLAEIGIELKTCVEKIREQVQNIE